MKTLKKVKDHLKKKVSEDKYKECIALLKSVKKLSKDKEHDQELLELAALLYNVGIDNAFEYLIEIDVPLSKAEKICNCITKEAVTVEAEILHKAALLQNMEIIEDEKIPN